MPDEYTALVTALKSLEQIENPMADVPKTVTLQMAEDEWYTRPDAVSYGIVLLQYEVDALHGDNQKQETAYSGSVHLFSLVRDGAGWVPLICGALRDHCDGCWSLNLHTYERETGLFHWEWTFQVEG